VNAAQSKEESPSVLAAANALATGESQVKAPKNNVAILEPILPTAIEAILNAQHAEIFEQQKLLFAEFQQSINYQRATIAAQPLIVSSSPCISPFPPICWPRNLSRPPHEEQHRYCCTAYLRYMVKKRNPFQPPVMGKPPHDSECTRSSDYSPFI
jgi:hypothetical protein